MLLPRVPGDGGRFTPRPDSADPRLPWSPTVTPPRRVVPRRLAHRFGDRRPGNRHLAASRPRHRSGAGADVLEDALASLPAGSAEGRRAAGPGACGRSIFGRRGRLRLQFGRLRATGSAAPPSARASAESPARAAARPAGWWTARPAGSGCAAAAATSAALNSLVTLAVFGAFWVSGVERLDQRRDGPVRPLRAPGGTYAGSAIRMAMIATCASSDPMAALRVRSPLAGLVPLGE